MDNSLPPLDVWVDELLARVFFQPDDEVALDAYGSGFSSDVVFEVNGKSLDRESYLQGIEFYRAKNIGKCFSNTTLSVFHGDAAGQSGAVAQVAKFSTTDKA